MLPGDAGANTYAPQTFSDIPARDGRRIQTAWMRGGDYPDMPFNQQMSFPCALTLHATPSGLRLYRWPVHEISHLYAGQIRLHDIALRPGGDYQIPLTSTQKETQSDLWDVQAEFAPTPGAAAFGLRVWGADIRYHVADGVLSCLGRQELLASEQGRVRIRFLLDRTSLEVFGNEGQVSLTSCFRPSRSEGNFAVYAEGGTVTLTSLTAHPLHSAWTDHPLSLAKCSWGCFSRVTFYVS